MSVVIPTVPMGVGVDLQPCERFEWERIVRRCQIPGPVKLVAFVLAQFGDSDGTRIRPGVARVAAGCTMSQRTAERHLATLRGMGLIEKLVNGGGRGGLAAMYRLTVPSDLMDRVAMTDPDERTPATHRTAMAGVSNSRHPDAINSRHEGGGSTDGVGQNSRQSGLNSRHAIGGSKWSDESLLPPSGTELPPKQALTPANDPPVTCDDAHHQETNHIDQPIRDFVGDPHQSAGRREDRLIHMPANLDLRAALRGGASMNGTHRHSEPPELPPPR